jgi:hypothetical protein
MTKEKPKRTRESTDQYLLRHWKQICREVDERKEKRRQKEDERKRRRKRQGA